MKAVAKDSCEPDEDRNSLRNMKHTPPGEYDDDGEDYQAKRRRLFSPYTVKMVELDDTCAEELAKMEVAEAKPGRSPLSPLRRPSSTAPKAEGGDEDEEAKLDFDLQAPRNVNSTSSIFASSTLAQPDTDQIILCMSAVLQIQMTHDVDAPGHLREKFRLFEEPPENGEIDLPADAASDSLPSVDEIYSLLSGIFRRAQFSAECNIIALIYINRVIAKSNLPLHRGNWRTIVLSAVILAQKVWDDKSLTTSTFTKIIPAYSRRQVRVFESKFLELLQYKATVTQALYARYYFELRSLFEQLVGESTDFPLKPTANWRLKKLEKRSTNMKMQRTHSGRSSHRREGGTPDSGAGSHVSFDFADHTPSARRVLS